MESEISINSLDTVHHLSNGAINALTVKRQLGLKPILQILDRKVLGTGKGIRVVLSDGDAWSRTCILHTLKLGVMQERKLLEKFTVIRVEHYDLRPLSPTETVVLIPRVTVLALGRHICRKLNLFDKFVIKVYIRSCDVLVPPEMLEEDRRQREEQDRKAATIARAIPGTATVTTPPSATPKRDVNADADDDFIFAVPLAPAPKRRKPVVADKSTSLLPPPLLPPLPITPPAGSSASIIPK